MKIREISNLNRLKSNPNASPSTLHSHVWIVEESNEFSLNSRPHPTLTLPLNGSPACTSTLGFKLNFLPIGLKPIENNHLARASMEENIWFSATWSGFPSAADGYKTIAKSTNLSITNSSRIRASWLRCRFAMFCINERVVNRRLIDFAERFEIENLWELRGSSQILTARLRMKLKTRSGLREHHHYLDGFISNERENKTFFHLTPHCRIRRAIFTALVMRLEGN